MWPGKFMGRYVIKLYYVLIRGDRKTLTDNSDELIYGGVITTLKIPNKISYTEPIIYQEDKVSSQIAEEAKTEYNEYLDAIGAWVKLLIKMIQQQGLPIQG